MGNYDKNNMLEKHYTTLELKNDMKKILDEFYQGEITEFLENSAGDGRLIDFLKSNYDVDVIAFDIKNETYRKDIVECDYLSQKIEYKKGRVAFINPPFNKGLKFVYKSLTESDYCVAILSCSSILNLDYSKYDVDTICVYRNFDFGSCKTNVCIMGIKNKV